MNKIPCEYNAELTDERLEVIACLLRNVRYEALQVTSTELDDSFTQETLAFGRSRKALIKLATSKEHPWLSLTHSGMDVTFSIGGVPCRFYRDDNEKPKKKGFFKRNIVEQQLELPLSNGNDNEHPEIWRFVIVHDDVINNSTETYVCFQGYTPSNELVSTWTYHQSTLLSQLQNIQDGNAVTTKEIERAPVDVLDDEDNQSITS